MLKQISVLSGLALLLLSGCALPRFNVVRGSGVTTTRNYPITGFTQVEVNSAFEATIRQGDTYAVQVTIDDNLLPYLVVEKVGDWLVIRYDTRQLTTFSSMRSEVAITLPALTGIKASGASQIRLMEMKTSGPLRITLSGASRVTGDASVDSVMVDASGASSLMLSGVVTSIDAELSGASSSDLSTLSANAANVRLSGASSATVNASKSLSYHVSGGSTLRYMGKPELGTQDVSGGSRAVALP